MGLKIRSFIHEPQGGCVKFFQLVHGRFLAGELHQVAAHQEVAEQLFLRKREQRAGLQFVEEFLGGPFRRTQ